MLFQFCCNAAALNLDLRLWMTALNDFTLPGGLVVGPRFFDKAPVLQDDIFSTPPWNQRSIAFQDFSIGRHGGQCRQKRLVPFCAELAQRNGPSVWGR